MLVRELPDAARDASHLDSGRPVYSAGQEREHTEVSYDHMPGAIAAFAPLGYNGNRCKRRAGTGDA